MYHDVLNLSIVEPRTFNNNVSSAAAFGTII